MKITVCDICRKEKDIVLRGKRKKYKEDTAVFSSHDGLGDFRWERIELCADCLNKIEKAVKKND